MLVPLVRVILPVVLEMMAEADLDTEAMAGMATKLLVFIFFKRLTQLSVSKPNYHRHEFYIY